MLSGFLCVDNVHEFAEYFAHAGSSIAASGIWSRYHYFLYWTKFFAFLSHIQLEVFHIFLIIEVFRVAHVEELNYSGRNFAELLVFKSHLNFDVGYVFVGEEVGAES